MTLFHRLISVMRWVLRRDRAEQQLDVAAATFPTAPVAPARNTRI